MELSQQSHRSYNDPLDLEDLADVVVENDLIVISDEVWQNYPIPGATPASPSWRGEGEDHHLKRLSKSHAMTGWRIGYAMGDPALIGAMTKIHQYTMLCAPTMAQVGSPRSHAIGQG